MVPRLNFIIGVLIAATLVGACDTAPGSEPLGTAPVISDLRYDPQAIVVESLPDGSVVDGIVTVPFSVSVAASDRDLDLDEVGWYVRGPQATGQPIVSGVLSRQDDGRWGIATDLSLPLAVTGRYTVVVYASDRAGRLSNDARGAIDLLAEGSPPVIEEVEMPERITRPAVGQPPVVISIVATVSDPDGAANVSRVETLINGQATLLLCDDGSVGACNGGTASGDAVASDGRYTLTIQVDATNQAGTNTFVFTAIDRSGLRSATITRQIVLE